MAARRAPFIAVETDLNKDERPAVIGDVCGYNRDEAIGKLFRLWSWCADRRLKDAPDDCDGYAVPDAVIQRFLGPKGVRGILGDGCDELALGARRPDGLIYLRGTSETVAGFRGMQASAVAGGLARAEQVRADSTRDGRGQFVSSTANRPHAESVVSTTNEVSQTIHGATPSFGIETNNQSSCSPAGNQPATSRQPAVTSVDPRSQIPDLGSDLAPPGDLVGAPLAALKPSRATRADRSVRMPDGWAPRSEELALARELGVDATKEAAGFRDHHSARGSRFVDWNAAFRTWLRNAVKFSRGGSSGAARGGAMSFFDVIDSLPHPADATERPS